MRGQPYNESFFKTEVERLQLLLTQSITPEARVQFQSELAAARQHLEDFQRKGAR